LTSDQTSLNPTTVITVLDADGDLLQQTFVAAKTELLREFIVSGRYAGVRRHKICAIARRLAEQTPFISLTGIDRTRAGSPRREADYPAARDSVTKVVTMWGAVLAIHVLPIAVFALRMTGVLTF
jgi:hypothetical protein